MPLSALVTGIALEMGPWTCFWLLLTGQNAFYLAHWEELVRLMRLFSNANTDTSPES